MVGNGAKPSAGFPADISGLLSLTIGYYADKTRPGRANANGLVCAVWQGSRVWGSVARRPTSPSPPGRQADASSRTWVMLIGTGGAEGRSTMPLSLIRRLASG